MKSSTGKLLLTAILFIQLIVLITFGMQKKGMHFDECFSYFNTNNSVGRMAYDRDFVSSQDIMKDFYVLPGEGFNYSYVVTLQSYDVHPPVFYILLHTVCSFMPGVFSLWQGLSLNIFYALITTIALYFILKSYIDNEYAVLVILLAQAINPGVVTDAMFIRMYCLLTMFMALATLLHVNMSMTDGPLKKRYYILNAVLAFLGFLTHYFYLVFLFFLEAGYWLPKLKDFKKNIKTIIIYGLSILAAGILGVVVYPSCLGHVNSGYRGTEVKSYLSDISDFGTRFKFFGELVNKYLFSNMAYIILLLVALLLVTAFYIKKRQGYKLSLKAMSFISCLVVPTAFYYLVAVKGGLMGDEAMVRYILPSFNFIIVILGIMIYSLLNFVVKKDKVRIVLGIIVASFILATEIISLVKGNVFYLYKEQENMVSEAENIKNNPCVYIYNNEGQKYLLWNDYASLAQFDRVYFADMENEEPIAEEEIANAKHLVVYVSTLSEHENFEDYANLIFSSNANLTDYRKIYDAVYAKCYEFY